MNVAVGGKDVMRNWSNVADNMRRCMICGLAFEGTKIGTKDSFGHLNMLFVDGAVANVIDGDVHEFLTPRSHDDVLYVSCENSIFILSFGECLGVASHC
jgi:prepilin-type processing-associated H-X9-DG protein